MNSIVLQQPGKIVFGENSFQQIVDDNLITSSERILFLVATPLLDSAQFVCERISATGKKVVIIEYNFPGEPTFDHLICCSTNRNILILI